jgi:hypothetical protein
VISERWAIFAKRSQLIVGDYISDLQRSSCASIGLKLTSGGYKPIPGDAKRRFVGSASGGNGNDNTIDISVKNHQLLV